MRCKRSAISIATLRSVVWCHVQVFSRSNTFTSYALKQRHRPTFIFNPSERPIIRVISEIHVAQTGRSKFHVSAAFHVGSRRHRRSDVFAVKAADKLQRRDLDRAIRAYRGRQMEEEEGDREREAKTKEASLTTRRLDNDLTGRYMRVSRVRLASRIASSPTISRRPGG